MSKGEPGVSCASGRSADAVDAPRDAGDALHTTASTLVDQADREGTSPSVAGGGRDCAQHPRARVQAGSTGSSSFSPISRPGSVRSSRSISHRMRGLRAISDSFSAPAARGAGRPVARGSAGRCHALGAADREHGVVAIGLSALALALWPMFAIVWRRACCMRPQAACLVRRSLRSASGSPGMAAWANGSGAMRALPRSATVPPPRPWGCADIWVSSQAVFLFTAALTLPALLALAQIRTLDSARIAVGTRHVAQPKARHGDQAGRLGDASSATAG